MHRSLPSSLPGRGRSLLLLRRTSLCPISGGRHRRNPFGFYFLPLSSPQKNILKIEILLVDPGRGGEFTQPRVQSLPDLCTGNQNAVEKNLCPPEGVEKFFIFSLLFFARERRGDSTHTSVFHYCSWVAASSSPSATVQTDRSGRADDADARESERFFAS